MLKKLRNLLIIVVVLGAIGYVAFLVFVNPAGFVNKEDLINSYFDNIASDTVCDDHFNSETTDYCTTFKSLIDQKTVEVSSLTPSGTSYVAVVLVDGVEIEFTFTFNEVTVTGIKSILNKTYYEIDFIV